MRKVGYVAVDHGPRLTLGAFRGDGIAGHWKFTDAQTLKRQLALVATAAEVDTIRW